MSGPRGHEAVSELLGAYALDAVDTVEADAVEVHLAECARCRAEVAEHREVAAMLAHGGAPAPDGVWDRILDSLEEPPPELRLDLVAERPPASTRRQVTLRVAAVVGAAAAVVAAVLAVQVVRLQDRVDTMSVALEEGSLDRAANLALVDPDAEQAELRSPDGAVRVRAVVTADGAGYLLAHNLPGLGDDRTYQLWGSVGGTLVSLGVLGAEPAVVAFPVASTVERLAITEEVAGGVPVSANPPLVSGTLS